MEVDGLAQQLRAIIEAGECADEPSREEVELEVS